MRKFFRDALARKGHFPQENGFYLTPEQSQELMPVDPVVEVRYDIIGICEICENDYDKVKHSQRYCSPECRRKVKQAYEREYDARPHRLARRAERHEEKKVDDIAFATPDPWTNIMLAVLQQATDDKRNTDLPLCVHVEAEDYLNDNGSMYRTAILGMEDEDG